MAVTYEFIDDGKSFVIKYKGQSYRAGKNDVELIIPNETNDNILKIRSNSAQLTDIEINLDEDTVLGVGAGSTTATALDSALGAIFFLEEGGGSGGGQVNTVTAQSPLEDSGTVNKTIKLEDGSTDSSQLYWDGSAWVEIDLPYTVANDLVTFDRDVQIPQTSLFVGDAIKMSDLAQSLSYTTQFDAKEYIIMGYEITNDGNQRPKIKSFSASSSFELQPLSDTTENFSGVISFDITSVQQVIGKTYRFNVLSDTDLNIRLYRLAEGTGSESKIVDEIIPASQTNLTGFDFDLTPIVDFEDAKVYRLEIDNGTGNGQIQGTLITGPNPYSVSPINVSPNFVPYIKRQVGWEYENKDIAYRDEGLSGLYPVFIDSDDQLNLEDRLVICQPVFAANDINLNLPDITAATEEKYFVEVYNGSENDDYDVIVKDSLGSIISNVASRDRVLYFPLGNTWESIVLSTQVFTDDSISGTGSYTDPLSVPKLYAHVGVTNDNPVQNNTNTPVLIDTWDLDLPVEALYNVHVTVEYNINVVNRDAVFRFDVNGATGININQESKDATNNIFFTTFAFDTLQAGVNTIEFYASIENPQNPSQRVEVRSNRYVARKIDELS